MLKRTSPKQKKGNPPGYPLYPAKDDIYNREREERDADPENPSGKKPLNDEFRDLNEKDFIDDYSGEDLDIPGAELDDDLENLGSEDEENNLYSLGGDDHDQ